MPRESSQKLKLLYVMRYLLRSSDEAHPVTVQQIIDFLSGEGIPAERKSIYDDVEALRRFGLDIIQAKIGRQSGYYVGSREFELPELKLLVDSVQSSKFITYKTDPYPQNREPGQRLRGSASLPAGLCEKPHQDHERVHLLQRG